MSIYAVNDYIWLATSQSKIYEKCPPQKIAKSALMVALFEQPLQSQIRPTSKYLYVHQMANDKTIVLSTENVQKVNSRPKL